MDPSWSRLVSIVDGSGVSRTFHVLDSHAEGGVAPTLTVVCVHGNPSWSFLWRRVLALAPPSIRVIAPDHLNMGYSERIDSARTLAQRVEDLVALTTELNVDGPVVTLAHDWGGPISLGWAQRHLHQLSGVVLTNTAVSQPSDSAPPWLITAAGSRGLLRTVTQRTPAFIRAGLRLSTPEPPAEVRAGFLAPYDTADRRAGVRDFVADIPLDPSHVSYETLHRIAEGCGELGEIPTFMMWGTRDPVFGERYLHDLEDRLPHADVHRFVGASHFVSEDAPVAEAFWAWVHALGDRTERTAPPPASLWSGSPAPGTASEAPLVTEWTDEGWRSIDASTFAERVDRVSRGLAAVGVLPGDRVATMIPPGIDLTVVLYSCWAMGATAVLVDAGLGVRNMDRAVRAAAPDWILGIPPAVTAARALGWTGRRIVAGDMDERLRRLLKVERSLRELEFLGESQPDPNDDGPNSERSDPLAAIGYTSGSTGPSKGVGYRSGQLAAQIDAIRNLYGITSSDRLVAAFAPFALYGPALGIGSVVPDMDVTKPATLTASTLADAVLRVDATLVFASPAALRNVVATADSLTAEQRRALSNVRLLMSAGAPLQIELLQAVSSLLPAAEVHTPYGMTEVLPVADISLAIRLARGAGPGTCVGRPLPGVDVRIHPLDALGRPSDEPTAHADVMGEVVVSAPHVKDGYDRLWWTEHRSTTVDGWHRTGDIGSLDASGFLWISGRVQHVITSNPGPLPPIPIEHAAERVAAVKIAAAVGVGPTGGQVVAVVVETNDGNRGPLASSEVAAQVKAELARDGLPLPAAVLSAEIPVDRRHNSKVDRTRVAAWAAAVLAGKHRRRI